MTDYPEYERQQELAHQGDHVLEYMKAVLDDWQPAHETLASLARRVYKDTDAGIAVSFQLDDGTCIWSGDKRGDDSSLVPRVHRIGFSSIVEGSDTVVPLRWLDLLDESLDSPDKAVAEFNRLADEVNDEACELWDEEHELPEDDSND